MKESLMPLLKCPECESESLSLSAKKRKREEILEGAIRCAACGKSFPIIEGVPYFVREGEYTNTFGMQWNFFRKVQIDDARSAESENTFRQKTEWNESDLDGKLVLDVGCGAGRFADVASRWGATIVGMDMSDAVRASHQNIGERPNVHIVRADVFRTPFRRGIFDKAFSIGVLHHTPDPRAAFRNVPPLVKPGGQVAIWVYNNGDTAFVERTQKLRKFTKKMNAEALLTLSLLSVPLYPLYRNDKLMETLRSMNIEPPFIHMHPEWQKRWLDTFDFYSPRFTDLQNTYLRVAEWFESAGLQGISFIPVETSVKGVAPGGDVEGNDYLSSVRALRDSLPGRELVLYGTGSAGQSSLVQFEAIGAKVIAFAESAPKTENATVCGRPVWSPARLAEKPTDALIVICSDYGRVAISQTLQNMGYQEGKDFIYYAYLL